MEIALDDLNLKPANVTSLMYARIKPGIQVGSKTWCQFDLEDQIHLCRERTSCVRYSEISPLAYYQVPCRWSDQAWQRGWTQEGAQDRLRGGTEGLGQGRQPARLRV